MNYRVVIHDVAKDDIRRNSQDRITPADIDLNLWAKAGSFAPGFIG